MSGCASWSPQKRLRAAGIGLMTVGSFGIATRRGDARRLRGQPLVATDCTSAPQISDAAGGAILGTGTVLGGLGALLWLLGAK